jgi:antitoxin Phd
MSRPTQKSGVHKPRDKAAKHEWQLQDAKARFSEVFRLARESGPQRVTKHGKTAVVVIPLEEYERLTSSGKQKQDLAEFFASSPLAEYRVEFERQRDFAREIDL